MDYFVDTLIALNFVRFTYHNLWKNIIWPTIHKTWDKGRSQFRTCGENDNVRIVEMIMYIYSSKIEKLGIH